MIKVQQETRKGKLVSTETPEDGARRGGEQKVVRRNLQTNSGDQSKDKKCGMVTKKKKSTEDSSWELVTTKQKRKPEKQIVAPHTRTSSAVDKFLEKYRFIGIIESFDRAQMSGVIQSQQLEVERMKFQGACVEGLAQQSQQLKGKRVFFFLSQEKTIQVRLITFAAEFMTPQRISGFISAWNGIKGRIKLADQKVMIVFDPAHVSTGRTDMVAHQLKLNCCILFGKNSDLHARDINLYTRSYKPHIVESKRVSLEKAPRFIKSPATLEVQSAEEKGDEVMTSPVGLFQPVRPKEYQPITQDFPPISKKKGSLSPGPRGPRPTRFEAILCDEENNRRSEDSNFKLINRHDGLNTFQSSDSLFSDNCTIIKEARGFEPTDRRSSVPLYRRKSSLCETTVQGNPTLTKKICSASTENCSNTKVTPTASKHVKKPPLAVDKNSTRSAHVTRRQKSTSICENTKKKSPPSFEFGADWDTYKLSADTQDLLNIKASGNARGDSGNALQDRIMKCLGEEEINILFSELKSQFTNLLADSAGCQNLNAFVMKVSKYSPATERKMTRILLTSANDLFETKGGCLLLKTVFDNFQGSNNQLLAECVQDLDAGQLCRFWLHGQVVFKLALEFLDEKGLGQIVNNLSGSLVRFSCHVKQHLGIVDIINKARDFDAVNEITEELEPHFRDLVTDRFGYKVLTSLIKVVSSEARRKIYQSIKGSVEKLAMHIYASGVVAALVQHAASDVQDLLIEEVCREKAGGDSTLVNLSLNHHGHIVVIAMLQVSYGRQSYLELKSMLLFKQDFLYSNPYAVEVLNKTKLI